MEEMQRRWEAERKELLAAQKAAPPPPATPVKYGPIQDDESAEVRGGVGWLGRGGEGV